MAIDESWLGLKGTPVPEKPETERAKPPTLSSHLRKELEPILDELEAERLGKLRLFKLLIGVALLYAAVVVAVIILADLPTGKDDSGRILFFTVIIPPLLCLIPHALYKGLYKDKVLPRVLEYFGDLHYERKGTLAMSELKATGIVPGHNRHSCEDMIFGTHKGVRLRAADVHLEKKRGKRSVTVFRGLCVLFDLPAPFETHTIVVDDLTFAGNWLRDTFNRLENVQLEDPRFEAKYEVYSDDQVAARVLLNPVMMETLNELSALFGGKKLRASFQGTTLFVMIEADNLFEPAGLFQPVRDLTALMKAGREVELMLSLIDELKLDKKAAKMHRALEFDAP